MMVPAPITQDLYAVLEVEPSADPKTIASSYKKLALKVHPDRNKNPDATAAFQLVQQAYEILTDVDKRREYDLTYPSLKRQASASESTWRAQTSAPSTSQAEFLSECAKIAAIEKSKRERAARWRISKNAFDTSILELQQCIRQLQQEIQNLNSIAAAEAAQEAYKNSWRAWLLSPLVKTVEESEDVKVRKDIERQERRIEKDMKERRLDSKKATLRQEEERCTQAKQKLDAADRDDERNMTAILMRRLAREERERQEKQRQEWVKEQKERQEREAREEAVMKRMAEDLRKMREEWEKQQQEAAETMGKRQAEAGAAEGRRQRAAQEQRQRQRQSRFNTETRDWEDTFAPFDSARAGAHQAGTSSCNHGGWWPKVEGRTPCPKCLDVWTYLLQCPGCKTKACPKCQAAMRPRQPRNGAYSNPRSYRPERSPSPIWNYDDFDHFD